MVLYKYEPLYLCNVVERVVLITSHLGSEFEHIMRRLWKVILSVRSRRVNVERWDVTTRMGPCSGLSAGQGSRLRESKTEELHCYQGAEAS